MQLHLSQVTKLMPCSTLITLEFNQLSEDQNEFHYMIKQHIHYLTLPTY